ncbi:proline iminopeptidase [Hyaloraphidium curvatum]|nr:proline iminopeptidase [Hyaloraphidium curvatum]
MALRTALNGASRAMKELYPAIEPHASGFLPCDAHSIYYEVVGNPRGAPVLFVHGGPGGGIGPDDRRYFNSSIYKVVLFDQRGAGKSKPAASVEDNTTWKLVQDMERLREHLKIEKWILFGGSWGSTLSLTYAINHPERTAALALRGIFLLRDSEIRWFYEKGGAQHLFPDFFDEYMEAVPEAERDNLVLAYHKRLAGPEGEERDKAAKAWSKWECATSRLLVDEQLVRKAENPSWALSFACIENHYFVNRGFFPTPNYILDNVKRIREHGIPGIIVQGRYDVVCPSTSAWELHKAWPEAEFHIVPDAGHSAKELGTRHLLVDFMDRLSANIPLIRSLSMQ